MQDVKKIIEDTVIGMNYDLVEIENNSGILSVYIDTLDINTNINIDDCVSVSNQLTRIFEVDDIEYKRLEVSTPGIDRPLKKYEHFVKYINHEAIVTFKRSFQGKKRFIGIILQPKDDKTLCLQIETEEHISIIDFLIDEVDKAKLSLAPYFDQPQIKAKKNDTINNTGKKVKKEKVL